MQLAHALHLAAAAVIAAAVVACGAEAGPGLTSPAAASGASAGAALVGRAGSALAGLVRFTEVPGGCKVEIYVERAPPGGHAVHLHEKGDCSAADFTSAGGHFNPGGLAHGAPGAQPHHAGDFGNIAVNKGGFGTLVLTSALLTVSPGDHSVVGKALIVHEQPDDFGQPTGNAGGRIACGVVR